MPSIAILYGLLSALTWGAGDFNGGLAVKRSNPYGVIAVAHALSLVLLLITVFLVGEPAKSTLRDLRQRNLPVSDSRQTRSPSEPRA